MATFYADARNGNDSNDGTTNALAWKTLGKAMSTAATGSTISCCGVFNEQLVAANKAMTFTADGFAVLDGTSSLAIGFQTAGAWAKTYTFNGFIFRNFTSYDMYMPNTHNCVFILSKCILENSPYGCYCFNSSVGAGSPCTFTNCVFRACSVVGLAGGTSTWYERVTYCTFTGCGTGMTWADTTNHATTGNFAYNIFSNNTTHINLATQTAVGVFNYNAIDFTTGGSQKCIYAGVNKTTLAAWQAAANGCDALSIDVVPLFIDAAKNCHMLQRTSPALLGAGQTILGAYNTKLAEAATANYNAGVWTGADAADCEIVSGNWQLTAGSDVGTVTFTFAMPTAANVRRIDLSHAYTGVGGGAGGGPSGILDYDKADTLPETWQYEYSVDTGGGYGAFTAVRWNDDLNLTGVVNIKVRVTLRKDAV